MVFFELGDPVAEVLLDMRGIFVGVSLAKPVDELRRLLGGPSLESLVMDVFAPPTDGDPAIVGSWFRPRKDVSDCFCIELTVPWVIREDEGALGVLWVDDKEEEEADLRLATL